MRFRGNISHESAAAGAEIADAAVADRARASSTNPLIYKAYHAKTGYGGLASHRKPGLSLRQRRLFP